MSQSELKNEHAPAAAAAEPFRAEVAQILDLMVHSVYSDRDIFLRELISNASDALDKLRYLALSNDALAAGTDDFAIMITPNLLERTLTIADNGVGMDSRELADNLGTIARSGTRAFVDELAEKKDGGGLIGRFGVGFYSAFMVADRVEVTSRKAGDAAAHRWISEGLAGYRIETVDVAEAPQRGTRIRLFFKDDALNYLEEAELERIVRAYSDHILFPIRLAAADGGDARQLNAASAIWARSRGDVSPQELTEFYRNSLGAFDDPALTLHYRAEGLSEYSVLLFAPATKPFDLYDPARKGRIKLYVRRVFISDDADLLPGYLRFMRGVVDSQDLPLNISREMLQKNPAVAAIKKAVTNRVLAELKGYAEKDAEPYVGWWKLFGGVLKEGLYEDPPRRDLLLELVRFRTSESGDDWRSLKDYVAAMKPGQAAIYYLAGESHERLAASPQLEGFRARGIEVILFTDPVDNFWVTTTLGYDKKPLQSVSRGDADLSAIPLKDAAATPRPEDAAIAGSLVGELKRCLNEAIGDVVVSKRLVDSPACLVAPGDGPDRGLERLLSRQDQGTGMLPNLEINLGHPVVQALARLAKSADQSEFADRAWLLLDGARIVDGEPPFSAVKFAERLNRALARDAER